MIDVVEYMVEYIKIIVATLYLLNFTYYLYLPSKI